MKPRSVSLLYALVALSGIPGGAQESRTTAAHTILFVCEHGSAKSVIAPAHFHRLAKEKRMLYRAISRGVNPDQEIPSYIIQALAGDGLDVTGWKPQKVNEQDVGKADRAITLACALPVKKSRNAAKVTEWNDIPSVSENYEVARKAIVDQVTELLKTLARK